MSSGIRSITQHRIAATAGPQRAIKPRPVILYGTISHDGSRYSVEYAYERHRDGGTGRSLSGYGPDVFEHALRDGTLHPDAVVIDYRSATFEAVSQHAIRGPMADDGQYGVPRGHVAHGWPSRVSPVTEHTPGSLDFIHWQDRADNAARIGATVTPWRE